MAHTVLLSEAGEVFVAGESKEGALGLGDQTFCPVPTRLSGDFVGVPVCVVAAGTAMSLAVLASASISTRRRHGSLRLRRIFSRASATRSHRPRRSTLCKPGGLAGTRSCLAQGLSSPDLIADRVAFRKSPHAGYYRRRIPLDLGLRILRSVRPRGLAQQGHAGAGQQQSPAPPRFLLRKCLPARMRSSLSIP